MGGNRRFLRLEIDLFAVAPEVFEVVKLTEFVVHHVHDHVDKIEHDPRRHPHALGGKGADVVVYPKFLSNFVDDGAKVRLVGAGHDNKIIGNGGEFTEIQKSDVFGLAIVGQPSTGECEGFGFHKKSVGLNRLLAKRSHREEAKPSGCFVNRKLAKRLPALAIFSQSS